MSERITCQAAYRTSNGTLEYRLTAGSDAAVSPIVLTEKKWTNATGTGYDANFPVGIVAVQPIVDIDGAGGSSVANLVVTSLTRPGDVILLVDNTGNKAGGVKGQFDTLNGGSAAEGAWTVVGNRSYMLTYKYDKVSGTVGFVRSGVYNDIALLPEPATIALLSIGLFAIRRKK